MKMFLERKIKKDIEKGNKLRIFENPNNLNPLDLERINENDFNKIHKIFWIKEQRSINLIFFVELDQLNVEIIHKKGFYLINLYNINCIELLKHLKENQKYFDLDLVFVNGITTLKEFIN